MTSSPVPAFPMSPRLGPSIGLGLHEAVQRPVGRDPSAAGPTLEQVLIGSCLAFSTAAPMVVDRLQKSHFVVPAHQVAWEAIQSILGNGGTLDLHTFRDWIDRSGRRRQTEPHSYFVSLSMEATTPDAVGDYANGILEDFANLHAVEAAAAIQAVAKGDAPARAKLDSMFGALQSAEQVIAGSQVAGPVLMGSRNAAVRDRIVATAASGSGVSGIPSFLPDMDLMSGGMFGNGDLVVIGARPSVGKTSFAGQLAEHVATLCARGLFDLGGKHAFFYSAEMSADELNLRSAARFGLIDSTHLRSGQLSPAEWAEYDRASADISKLPLIVDDRASLSAEQIPSVLMATHRKTPLAIACFDYLQLMRGFEYMPSQDLRLGAITRMLKHTARALGIPVVILSQLNRLVEAREDRRPVLADLRYSGSIEQDADGVIFLYREEIYEKKLNPKDPAAGNTEVIIGKSRHGPIGTCYAKYRGQHYLFEPNPDGASSGSGRVSGRGTRKRRGTSEAGPLVISSGQSKVMSF